MSVINQVLKELDKRGASGSLEDPAVRVVYRVSSRDILLWVLTGAIGMLLLGGLVWLLYTSFFQHESPPASVVAAKPLQAARIAAVSAVPAVELKPEVETTSPPMLMAIGKPQILLIHGKNFGKVKSVTLRDSQGIEYANREILSRTDSLLELKINVGRTAGSWQLVLLDQQAHVGKPFAFEVQLPGAVSQVPAKAAIPHTAHEKPAPAIAAIEPAEGQVEKHATRMNLQQQAENEYRRSVQLQRLGQVNEAMNGFENALKLDPKHEPARLAMATVLIGRQQLLEAENLLREGLHASVQQTQLAFLLARLQVEQNDIAAALTTLQDSQPYANSQGEYLAFHAVLLQKMERHHEAADYFSKALQLIPKNAVWLMGMGISLRADKQDDGARAAFQKALDSNTLNAELRRFVAQQLRELETAGQQGAGR